MEPFPLGETVVLRASRRKWVRVSLMGLAFVAAGLVMILRGDAFGWVTTVLFGLFTLGAAANVARPGTLTLSSDGLRVDGLGTAPRFYPWVLCRKFRPWSVSSFRWNAMVVFDYAGLEAMKRPRLGRASRAIFRANCALPDTYGRTADELCRLLNDYQSAATTRRGPVSAD